MRPIKHNPEYNLLAEALERYVGSDTGTMMRSPFLPLSTSELRDLIKSAGFAHVRILIGVGTGSLSFCQRIPGGELLAHRWQDSSNP